MTPIYKYQLRSSTDLKYAISLLKSLIYNNIPFHTENGLCLVFYNMGSFMEAKRMLKGYGINGLEKRSVIKMKDEFYESVRDCKEWIRQYIMSNGRTVDALIKGLDKFFPNQTFGYKYEYEFANSSLIYEATYYIDKDVILLYINDAKFYRIDWKQFVEDFDRVILHELIHAEQYKRRKRKPEKQPATEGKEYYADYEEVSAYAHSIAMGLVRKGIDNNEKLGNLLECSKPFIYNISPELSAYMRMFEKDKKVLQRFYKHLYYYVKEFGEGNDEKIENKIGKKWAERSELLRVPAHQALEQSEFDKTDITNEDELTTFPKERDESKV